MVEEREIFFLVKLYNTSESKSWRIYMMEPVQMQEEGEGVSRWEMLFGLEYLPLWNLGHKKRFWNQMLKFSPELTQGQTFHFNITSPAAWRREDHSGWGFSILIGSIFNESASLEILLGMTLPWKPGTEKDMLLSMRTNECTKKPFLYEHKWDPSDLYGKFLQAWREHCCSSNPKSEVSMMFLSLPCVYEGTYHLPSFQQNKNTVLINNHI